MSDWNFSVGLRDEATFTVDASMSPPHLPAKVLSTPSMVGLIEGACLEALQSKLPEGHTTVGTHISVSHTGPAFEGEEVSVRLELTAIDKRRLTFDVVVESPRGSISSGTHERAVVSLDRFG